MTSPKRVCVIGAGAAGLVAARELLRCGLDVVVFERHESSVGGVWVVEEEEKEEDILRGCQVHSSMYRTLRTNLPRDLMPFLDFPMDSRGGGEDDWPRYPSCFCVAQYLDRFAEHFHIKPYIRFGATVTAARKKGQKWEVHVAGAKAKDDEMFLFDSLVVANGHYSRPRVVELPGMDSFPGTLMHSHNYRAAEVFCGQTVAILGGAASGVDLMREIRGVAKQVYFCATSFPSPSQDGNVMYRPMVKAFKENGTLEFDCPSGTCADSEPVDTFIYCTGYHFAFPFLPPNTIQVDDNWVSPLYRHMIFIEDSTLAFIGLPIKVIPFPVFEMQAKFYSRFLRGDFVLPSREEMMVSMREDYETSVSRTGKRRHAHVLGERQVDYYNALADQCGEEHLPSWHLDLKERHYAHLREHPEEFRDRPLPHAEGDFDFLYQ